MGISLRMAKDLQFKPRGYYPRRFLMLRYLFP
jgi:hypothetical protein